MSLTAVNKKENNQVELEITVGAEEFKAAVDAAFKKNAPKIQIPGFRKGKAPRKMIEKMYGEGVFYEDAVNELYPKAYEAAVDEADIEPVDRADIEVEKVDADGFTFKATVTVKPEVEVSDYKGIKAEKTILLATEEEVNSEIDRRREQNARIITVEGRAAENGDTAHINFEGFLEGKPFAGGKGEDYPLVLGSGSFIPGFEEQVVGHNAGDEFEVNVSFPEDYHAEDLKGKAVVFNVKVLEIKNKELPELDDEFAKDISEFDTLDQLKEDIKAKLQQAKDEQSKTQLENTLVEKVIENMKGDIPQCMIDRRVDELIREFEYRLQSQGLNLQTYLKFTGGDMDAFRKNFEEQANVQVKTRLALEKIAQVEKLDATQEELDAEYKKIAESYGMEADKVKELLPEKEIKKDIASGKALDLIRDTAVVKEVAEKKEKAEKPKKTAKKASKSAEGEEEKPKKTTKAAKAADGEEKPKKAPKAKKVKEEKPADAE
ncbi:trigger factor [Youxingia wuxianensis]|uniref:Trigger factor n=1 Tax=Youxingia wuxianensis TaxID=2763678 RepID=A0A926ELH0_9FIRM|nr:trigger factor [Youxingia wuxianensis]MBC8584063.1 trigger factor [Youxingia wuxianensis]